MLPFFLVSLYGDSLTEPSPYEKNNHSFHVTASYTLWKPYQEGMDVLYSLGTDSFFTLSTIRGDVVPARMYTRSGFKVGFEKYTESDWNFGLNYTWFYNYPKLKNRTLISDITYLSPFVRSIFRFDTLSSQFINQFNRIDATFKRTFISGKSLTLSPSVGLLSAFDKQFLNYFADVFDDDETLAATFKQDWWGAGPYGAVDCTCYFYEHIFGLFIRPGAALLYTNHEISQEADFIDLVGEKGSSDLNTYETFYDVEPMAEVSLGLILTYDAEKWSISAEAAWEIQNYFSHNGWKTYYQPVLDRGNYSMQGLTAGFTIGF